MNENKSFEKYDKTYINGKSGNDKEEKEKFDIIKIDLIYIKLSKINIISCISNIY